VISGERGIGKSSLLYYLKILATGRITTLDEQTLRFLVLDIELQPSTTYGELIKKVGAEFGRVLSSHEKARELLKSVWEFVTRWQAFGVSYKAPEKKESPPELLEDLTHTISEVLVRLGSETDGLVILIDEADKPPADTHLGQFVKLLTQGVTKRGAGKFLIGLAGLPTLTRKLRISHESSLRVFQFLELLPLQPSERVDVIRKGLADAKTNNEIEVTITGGAEQLIAGLSEGYPHFIQQFAYSAFDGDKDNIIDEKDVIEGAFKAEGGAFHQLGIRYFEDMYFDKIFSDEYREVLRAISDHVNEWVDRKTLQKATGIRMTTLDNALVALKSRNIIIPRRGKKGEYRLPTQSFGVWIKAFTQAQPRKQPLQAPDSPTKLPGDH
jgi:hypothetical protein